MNIILMRTKMSRLKKLLGRLNPFGATEAAKEESQTFLDEHNIVPIRSDAVMIATTDDFKVKQGGSGDYLPEEQEEAIQGILPKKATPGSAGVDLKAWLENEDDEIEMGPGQTCLIKTGFKWAIPLGFVGMVCSRSGLAAKNSVFVLNAPGIIDSDYRGDVGIILHNAGKDVFKVHNGDRIAQMVIIKTSELPLMRVTDIDVGATT